MLGLFWQVWSMCDVDKDSPSYGICVRIIFHRYALHVDKVWSVCWQGLVCMLINPGLLVDKVYVDNVWSVCWQVWFHFNMFWCVLTRSGLYVDKAGLYVDKVWSASWQVQFPRDKAWCVLTRSVWGVRCAYGPGVRAAQQCLPSVQHVPTDWLAAGGSHQSREGSRADNISRVARCLQSPLRWIFVSPVRVPSHDEIKQQTSPATLSPGGQSDSQSRDGIISENCWHFYFNL